jgi:PucR family transcriptional regulator, purine catabolism regulatory protein
VSETADTGALVSALQAQNAALRQLISIHDRLGALVLQGADIGAVTRMLSDLVGRRVLLLDPLLQVLAMAPVSERFEWAPRQGYVRAALATLARERRPIRIPPMPDFGVDASCVLAPVALGDAILGYLALLPEDDELVGRGDDVDLQIVQHAANVYALSMMRERMAAEVARQFKDELFEGLLSGRPQDEQVARERAMRLGYSPDVVYRVVVLVVHSAGAEVTSEHPELLAQRRRLLESLAELCSRRSPGAFATLRDDDLVVLMPDGGDARELGHTAVRHASALGPDWRVTVGVGGRCTSASAIASSYAQARRALDVSQRFYPAGHGDVVLFEDLGLYRLLFHVGDAEELRGFTEQVLGALLEYDQRHNADFVRTLAAFLDHNGNLQATARELNLHVNSVAYRMQRVQAIAALDLERSDDRLLAQVALKILRGLAP